MNDVSKKLLFQKIFQSIYLSFFLMPTLFLYASRITNEIEDIHTANATIENIRKNFNEQNFQVAALRDNSKKEAFIVSNISIEDNQLIMKYIKAYQSHEDVICFDIEKIESFFFDDMEFKINKDYSIFLQNFSDIEPFFKKIEAIKHTLDFKNQIIDKILNLHLLKNNGKFINDHYIYSKLNPKDKLIYLEMRKRIFDQKVKKIISIFNCEHSLYNLVKTRNKSQESFEHLICEFLDILCIEPDVIQEISTNCLVDIFKQIMLQNLHIEAVNQKLTYFFIQNSRSIILKLREESDLSGERILTLLKKKNISKKQFFDILRKENDIIWLAVSRNQNKQISIEEQKAILNTKDQSRIIVDLYNYDDIIKISKIHILLALRLFQQSKVNDWKEIISDSLNETKNEQNLLKKRDFAFPYGRWAQAGQIMSEYIKTQDKLQEKSMVTYTKWNSLINKTLDHAQKEDYYKFLRDLDVSENPFKTSPLEALIVSDYKSVPNIFN